MSRSGRPRSRGKKGRKLVHASKLEDTIIQNLRDRKIEYEYEPRTFTYSRPVRRGRCTVCESTNCVVSRSYTPDLRIRLPQTEIWIEIKGKFTAENRSAMEDFLKGNPEIDLRFIFQRDNWLTSKHKNKYSDWAKKLGVKYHIGQEVPEEWLKLPNAK